jgi:Holliday junction resolvasome RuvABC endonuclease subunit
VARQEGLSIYVLSLDQASKTGWSLYKGKTLINHSIEDFNNIEDYTARVSAIKQWALEMINKYNPEIISIEDIQQQINPKTYKQLAELKGVLENLLFEKEFLYFIISSSQWKGTCGVKGRKREEQKKNAQLFVKNKFNIDVGEDEADAICQGWHVVTKIVPEIVKENK